MEKIKPPFTKYPGNRWMARQVEKTGSESSIPFIHGVVRGALASPSAVDPGAVLEEVLKDAEPEGLFNDNFDKLSMAFLFLYNDTARSLTSSRPLPQALSSDIRTEAGWHFLLLEVSDLADGFVRGFNLKELPDKHRFPDTLAILHALVEEGDWCRMMFEDRRLLEKTFPRGCFLEDIASEAAKGIDECIRKVAMRARQEAREQRTDGLQG